MSECGPRVAVLGAGGFLGRHAVDALAAAGAEVRVVVRGGRAPASRWPPGVGVSRVEQGDDALVGWLRDVAPEVVVDCAWAGVRSASRALADLQDANVRRVRTLLTAVEPGTTRQWVGLGSQAEYGVVRGAVAEAQPLRPDTAYGRAKVAVHDLLREQLGEHGVRVAWLRVFAAYGPHQPPGWLVPDAVARLLRHEPVALDRPGLGCDYTYAADLGRAVAAVVTAGAEGGLNVGTGAPVTVHELVLLARELCGSTSDVTSRGGAEDVAWWADPSALVQATGWHPSVSLRDGMRATVDFVRDCPGNDD